MTRNGRIFLSGIHRFAHTPSNGSNTCQARISSERSGGATMQGHAQAPVGVRDLGAAVATMVMELQCRAWPAPRDFMGGLLNKILLVDLFQGLWVTFRNQNPKYIYTEQYPAERPKVAERYRGAPRLNINPDTNETLCISCNLCALACPENLIVVTSVRNEQTRRKDLTAFTYDLSRCMFCGLCEDACPVDALELTQDFELASYTREGGIWDRQMLEEGPRPTQYK